jgi:tRNA threonylcarbamoyladenosine biosynthesis protein TsaB
VASSNAAARGLYESFGFRPAGLRRNYYDRGGGLREDAVVMRKDLAQR